MSRNSKRSCAVLVVIATTVLACGQDPLEPHRPPTFSIASGDDQSGAAGAPLEPLVVTAREGDGSAMSGAEVTWLITKGEGLFRVWAGGEIRLVSSLANVTEQGVAKAALLPMSVGTIEVTAYASRPTRAAIGSARFTADIDAVAIQLDGSLDWEAPWPAGPQGVTVDVGTTVRWQLEPTCCVNRIMSIEVPAGGTPFDTTLASTDSVFEFVPDAPGTWTWGWEREIDDDWWPAIVTETATLVVQ